MRTNWPRVLGGLLGIGAVLTTAAPAHAFSKAADLYFNALVITVVPDVVFATYGIVVAARGELPSSGWSIAETAVAAPQTIFYTTYYAAELAKDGDAETLPAYMLIPAVGVSALTTHGIWSAATTSARPGVLVGASIAVGADAVLTTGVIASTATGRPSGTTIGVITTLLTAPQIAAGAYLAATSPASSRAGWIGLTAWSGALFVHGLASAIHGRPAAARTAERKPLPLPPPTIGRRAPLIVPGSIHLAPTVVTDGVASVPGLALGGTLF